MSLQDAINDELPFLRQQAEARMLSTCTVRRMTGRTTQNESTGEEVPVWDVIYAGPMRLGTSTGNSPTRTETISGVEVQRALNTAHFPVSALSISDGDLIDITAGENAGVVLRVVDAAWADQRTARRYPVESTERPGEW